MTKTELKAHIAACEMAAEKLRDVAKSADGAIHSLLYAAIYDLRACGNAYEAELARRNADSSLERVCNRIAAGCRVEAQYMRDWAESLRAMGAA